MKIGGLFFGYGGLDLAVQSVWPGAELAWYSEFDKGANKIAAHRFPGTPNHGDITQIDWSQVEPVDILTGGSPCQDLSHAGRRAGMTEGTRSNLWVAMREAIAQLRPSLRALGRVLGDLSDLGYDARWHGLRAADVGAPHGRFRVFVVATRNTEGDDERDGRVSCDGRARGDEEPPRAADRTAPDARRVQRGQGGWSLGDTGGRDLDTLTLLGTPRASEWKGCGPVGSKSHAHRLERDYLDAQVLTLPPAQPSRLLPTPMVGDAASACNSTATRHKTPPTGVHAGDTLTDVIRGAQAWGDYAAAIARWEHVLRRPAPAPTMTSTKGNPQLSPAFVEWMMGLPAGWVTDVPGITRNEALKALGNGVCPQQAAAALREMFAWGVAA